MKNKFKVACFQTKSSEVPEDNIYMLEKIFSKFNSNSIDLICLPECVSIFSDSRTNLNDYAKRWHKVFIEFISEYAKKLNSNILIGSYPQKQNNKFLNRSLLIGSNGKEIAHYDKINLFNVKLEKNETYKESKNFISGKKLKLAKLPWGKLGFSICYDLRFPSLYRKLSKKGAGFFSIPAAFTNTTGKVHWHSLTRARAIENGCFVFAAAQCGCHKNGRKTFGHSLIINPWGEIIAEAKPRDEFISAIIDTKLITFARQKIPAMTDYKF